MIFRLGLACSALDADLGEILRAAAPADAHAGSR